MNNSTPLAMNRSQKLKVFAVSSCKHSVPTEDLRGKTALSIVFAYSDVEAIMAAGQSIKNLGQNPDEYLLNFQVISTDLSTIIPAQAPVEEKVEEKKNNTEDYVVDLIKNVFDLVGTKTEKAVARKVIKKFTDHVSKNNTESK